MDKNYIIESLKRIISRISYEENKEKQVLYADWCWDIGVTFIGVEKVYNIMGEQHLLEIVRIWLERHESIMTMKSPNCVALANAELFMFLHTKEKRYLDICTDFADWCENKALKTANGGLAHVWARGGLEDYKQQLWLDTLFMAGIFMLRMGRLLNNKKLFDAGLEQFDIHIESMLDTSCNLFCHGYNCVEKITLGEHWGRGNGWVAAAMLELLELSRNIEYDQKKYLDVFKAFMESVYGLKHHSGMLHTLLDGQDSYLESTATALFAYAALKGFRLGYLDKKFEEWGNSAAERVLDNIQPDGTVVQCSSGTDCQERQGYLKVPYECRPYAYGCILLLLSELI